MGFRIQGWLGLGFMRFMISGYWGDCSFGCRVCGEMFSWGLGFRVCEISGSMGCMRFRV